VDTATPRFSAILTRALWFGLLTGLIEAALTGVKAWGLGRFVRVQFDLAWMAPVMDAIAFAVVATAVPAVLALIPQRARARRLLQAVPAGVFAFLGLLSVLLMYYPLHLYAKVLLALGLAVQVARLAGRYAAGFDRLIARTFVPLIAIVVLVAVGTRVAPALASQRRVAALPAAAQNTPNVLLIVWDTVRAKNASLYGYARKTTPHLEQWAATSTVFDRALSTSPWTLPSHASLLTGQWPQDLSTNWEQALDAAPRTLAEALAARGYLTAGFVANTYYCGHELGLARGFGHYEDYVASWRELLISSTLVRSLANSEFVRRAIRYDDNIPRRTATNITDQFLGWQASATGRPFFAMLNYFDAHESYLPPDPYAHAWGSGPPPHSAEVIQDVRRSLRRDWRQRPPAEIRAELDQYDGAISYLDAELDRLMTSLQSRGLLDNTIVIVTSDHGEQFGEHGLFLHGNSLYTPLLHVPLLIRFPRGVPAGRRVVSTVSLRDVPATILELASAGADLPGRSLSRFWSGAPVEPGAMAIAEVRHADWAEVWAPEYPVAKGNLESVTDDEYHYIRGRDGAEELYALKPDPDERQNLAALPASAAILEKYRAALRDRAPKAGRQP